MNTLKRIVSLLLVLLLLSACAPSSKKKAADLPANADVNPVALDFDIPEVGSYEDFSVLLSAALLTGTENRNFSPVSAYFALAMAAEGANGKTRSELLSLLGCETAEALREETSRMQTAFGRPAETGEIALCNSLWMSDAVSLLPSYRDRLSETYDAKAETVSFGTDAAAKRIAGWITEKTNGLITPSPDAMQFGSETLAVLLNTVYFRDQWQQPFGSAAPGTFTRADGTTVSADFLHRLNTDTGIVRGDGFLRYSVWYESKGRITFVLPDEGTPLSDLLGTPEKLDTLLNGGERIDADVDLLLPKFSISDRLELTDVLCSLGILDAFTNKADFSRMADVPVRLDRVIQETVIALDETGLKAAGYTEVMPAPGDPAPGYEDPDPLPLIEFHLDRPFLFLLKGPRGITLFVGTVTDPAA